jgi:hypothetical protein
MIIPLASSCSTDTRSTPATFPGLRWSSWVHAPSVPAPRRPTLCRAHAVLREALVTAHGWVRVHAAEALIDHGQAIERPPDTTPMKLSLFRFDSETLAVTRGVLLDNAGEKNIIDGCCAVPYWRQSRGRTYFNVITYKRTVQRHPDILRLEFD